MSEGSGVYRETCDAREGRCSQQQVLVTDTAAVYEPRPSAHRHRRRPASCRLDGCDGDHVTPTCVSVRVYRHAVLQSHAAVPPACQHRHPGHGQTINTDIFTTAYGIIQLQSLCCANYWQCCDLGTKLSALSGCLESAQVQFLKVLVSGQMSWLKTMTKT